MTHPGSNVPQINLEAILAEKRRQSLYDASRLISEESKLIVRNVAASTRRFYNTYKHSFPNVTEMTFYNMMKGYPVKREYVEEVENFMENFKTKKGEYAHKKLVEALDDLYTRIDRFEKDMSAMNAQEVFDWVKANKEWFKAKLIKAILEKMANEDRG